MPGVCGALDQPLASRARPWPLFAVVIGVVLTVSSCGPPSTATSSGDPTTTVGATATDCPNIDLRSPQGERVDLTGTWGTEREGTRGGIYFIRQIGSCVWFAGAFPGPLETDDLGPLGFLTVVFHGEVTNDFTISGDWVDVRHLAAGPPGPGGNMDLAIEFTDAGDVRLVYLGGTGVPFVEPGYREQQSWFKISESGEYPLPSPAP